MKISGRMSIGLIACIAFTASASDLSSPRSASAGQLIASSALALAGGGGQDHTPIEGSETKASKKTWLSKAERKEAERKSEEEQARQMMKEATDALFAGALAAGKSIVVSATVDLNHKYASPAAVHDNNAMYTNTKTGSFITETTSASEWKNLTSAGGTFKVGYEMQADKIGLEGSLYQFVAGRSVYHVFIVEPGAYSLAGHSFDVPRTLAPLADTLGQTGKSGLGRVTFNEIKNTEFERGQEWRDAAYKTETVQSSYCTLVIGGSNHCLASANRSDEVTRQTHAAGYYNTMKSHQVDGVKVHARISKEFASFNVAAGEAVLVDGLYAESPTMNYDDKNCQRVASDKVECNITDYFLTHVPAFIEEVKSSSDKAVSRGYPQLAAILSQLQYRPLQVKAKRGDPTAAGAQTYALSADE